MKKVRIFILLLIFPSLILAQTSQNLSYKMEFMGGKILKHTKHLEQLVKDPVFGAEFDVEWQTMGEKPWHQYFGFPSVGVGLVGMNLGNSEMLGQLMAVYPYMNIKLFHSDFLRINLKGGAGMSFLNKRFNNTATNLNDLNSGNAAIGSILNVYFTGGGNVEVPFSEAVAAVASFNWNHASNGSFYQPNSGINMLNASVGLTYSPNYKQNYLPVRKNVAPMPQKFTLELIASGGARELYYRDDKMFPTGSFVVSLFRQVGNNIRIGLGVDGFYDGVYGSIYISKNNPLNTTKYEFTYIESDEFKNKIRVGASLQPELVLGRLTAGLHVGIYLYNPIKNLEPFVDTQKSIEETGHVLNKPLIYKYNIENENGWLYTRAALKYAISPHVFISLGLKTHLQKAEFIEWGLGLRL